MAATPTPDLGFQNFFSALLTGDITSSSTDIPMDAIPNSSQGFLVIEPDSTTNREVIFYDSKTALKVVCPSAADGRGQDDTTAVAHSTGAQVIMAPVSAFFEALQSMIAVTDGSVITRLLGASAVTGEKLGQPVAFRATLTGTTGNLAYTSASVTLTEVFDYGGNFANASGFTAPYDGVYEFHVWGGTTDETGRTIVKITADGTQIAEGFMYSGSANNDPVAQAHSGPIALTAGQVVTVLFGSEAQGQAVGGGIFCGNLIGRTA